MAGVQSIERAFAILRALSLGPSGVTDLSERTGLPKSTVSRLLSSLESERAVGQLDDGTYELADGLTEIGASVRLGQSATDTARPHMAELMELTGEAVGLNRFDGTSVKTLLQIDDPASSVVVRDWTGEPTPTHAVAAGLAIVAHSNRATRASFLAQDFEKFTTHTVTDAALMNERLSAIRSDGYAWTYEEFSKDINSVAAPIADANGRTTLALHIHGPSFRFPNGIDEIELGTRVAATAQRIENQLADSR